MFENQNEILNFILINLIYDCLDKINAQLENKEQINDLLVSQAYITGFNKMIDSKTERMDFLKLVLIDEKNDLILEVNELTILITELNEKNSNIHYSIKIIDYQNE